MGDDFKPGYRLIIGSISAAAVLTGFISYVSIQLNDINVNRAQSAKQLIMIEKNRDDITAQAQSSAHNKMQNTHLKQTMGRIHGFGDGE